MGTPKRQPKAKRVRIRIRKDRPGFEGKYGSITSSKKFFFAGEPLFLLRGTDPLAVATIASYHSICDLSGCSREHLAAIKAHARRMADWQAKHPELVKELPD